MFIILVYFINKPARVLVPNQIIISAVLLIDKHNKFLYQLDIRDHMYSKHHGYIIRKGSI